MYNLVRIQQCTSVPIKLVQINIDQSIHSTDSSQNGRWEYQILATQRPVRGMGCFYRQCYVIDRPFAIPVPLKVRRSLFKADPSSSVAQQSDFPHTVHVVNTKARQRLAATNDIHPEPFDGPILFTQLTKDHHHCEPSSSPLGGVLAPQQGAVRSPPPQWLCAPLDDSLLLPASSAESQQWIGRGPTAKQQCGQYTAARREFDLVWWVYLEGSTRWSERQGTSRPPGKPVFRTAGFTLVRLCGVPALPTNMYKVTDVANESDGLEGRRIQQQSTKSKEAPRNRDHSGDYTTL